MIDFGIGTVIGLILFLAILATMLLGRKDKTGGTEYMVTTLLFGGWVGAALTGSFAIILGLMAAESVLAVLTILVLFVLEWLDSRKEW